MSATTGTHAIGHSQAFPVRVPLGLAGISLAVWALASARFREAAGFPEPALLLPLAGGIAIGVVALSARTSFSGTGVWFAWLVLGQAAMLRLVDAGPSLHYQHLRGWSELIETQPLATGLLAAQAAVVLRGISLRRAHILSWIGQGVGWRPAVLLPLFISAASATVSIDVGRYLGELALATLLQLTAIATLGLMVAELPDPAAERIANAFRRVLDGLVGPERRRLDLFVACCAIAVLGATALLNLLVYERHPHVQDEVKYLYHARYFAAGLLAMAPPPVPEAFELFLLEVGPRGWFSVVPPGWPLVLAVGERLGAAWLVNPVLAAANVLLAYLVIWRLYDRRTARLATLLLCASPWYLFLGMSFMPHMVTLFCLLVATLAVMRARETGQSYPMWIGGAAVGFLSLVRQLDGLVVAGLLGLWSIGIGGRRLKLRALAAFVAATALVGSAVLPYNRYFTGSATTFPIMAHIDRQFGKNSNAYGFGPDRGLGWAIDPYPGHGLRDAIVNTNLNATAMNVELFGWSTGSLVFILFLAIGGRMQRSDWLPIALAAGVFVAYFFNYFSGGPDFGARYWFMMILPGVVLTARGIDAVAASLGGSPTARARVASAALAAAAAALLVFVPWRALDKYHHYLDMRPDVTRLSGQHAFGRDVVLIGGTEFPDFASAAIYNPLDLHADAPVYAWNRSSDVLGRLALAYRDRRVWLVDGPTRTGDGYRVVAGPVSWDRAASLSQHRDRR